MSRTGFEIRFNVNLRMAEFKKSKSYFGLSCNDNDFLWKVSIENLKEFVQSKLKLDGSSFSPGGDVKLFVCEKYSLKKI